MEDLGSSGLVRVGMFSEGEGLALNGSLVVTYDAEGQEKAMAEVRSRCIDVEACGSNGGTSTARPAKRNNQYLQVSDVVVGMKDIICIVDCKSSSLEV